VDQAAYYESFSDPNISHESERLALPAHMDIIDPLRYLSKLSCDILLEEWHCAGSNVHFCRAEWVHGEANLLIRIS
jgi:hypothetical protein